MAKNSNLHKAKREKNNEFYTQLSDIENELQHYESHFKGKIVYSNCDSPDSNFVKYFNENKERLGIKEFYHTWFNQETGEGSFNSIESIELLKECDIVVSNSPFSLFRDFVGLLVEHDKKFIIVGSINAITYKDVFKLIKENKLWLGTNHLKQFMQPDGTIKKFGNICWFTNLEHKKRNEPMILYKTYKGNESEYPTYDNYDAVEISKTVDIPLDFKGVMGVPISWLDKFCPEQFEIVGLFAGTREKSDALVQGIPTYLDEQHKKYVGAIVNGKATYARILIKNKNPK